MSGAWQTSDKPIQATDRESGINVFPSHFASPAPANDISSSPLATSGAGVGVQVCDAGDRIPGDPQLAKGPENEIPAGRQRNEDSYESSPYFKYRKLIDSIAQRLLKENALRLAYLYDLPNWYHEVGPTHDPTSALRILAALEGKGLFAPNKLTGLAEALDTIEREDLAKLVRDFRKFTPFIFFFSIVTHLSYR